MKLLLLVTADTNDADYVTSTQEVKQEDIDKIMPMIEAIKNFRPYETSNGSYTRRHRHNFPSDAREDLGEKTAYEYYVKGNLVTEEQFEAFREYVQGDSEGRYHTVQSVRLLKVMEDVDLLKD